MIVVDTELAADLNLTVGDRVRLVSNTGASDTFTVAGVYSPEDRDAATPTSRCGRPRASSGWGPR